METVTNRCVHCERDDSQLPLLPFRFRDAELWICSDHFPVLVHKPEQLRHKLPGAEALTPVKE